MLLYGTDEFVKPVRFLLSVSLCALILVPPCAVSAQDLPDGERRSEPDSNTPSAGGSGLENFDNDIVVVAERIRGQVDTDLPPILELDEGDIAAYGADSLTDLVAQLAPQTSSGSGRGSGRPIFLINGRRVSGFREFRRYPPEAIKKVEVLPEEVALQFGFAATQRVVNFILKDNFASRELEAEYGGPSDGGRSQGELEASILTINGADRLLGSVEYNTASLLTEAERDIIQTPGSISDVASDPDQAAFRSLASDTQSIEVEGTYNTSVGKELGAPLFSLNGNFNRSWSRSLFGLDAVGLTAPDGSEALRIIDDNPLTRRTTTTILSGSSTLNQSIGEWKLDLTADASHTLTDTDIDRRRDTSVLVDAAAAGTLDIFGALPMLADAGQDKARQKNIDASTLATFRGTPVILPAGEVNLTFDTGYSWNRIQSSDTRTALGETTLRRGDLSAGVNVGIPLASAREGFLEPLGELSLNLGAGLNELSDFGTLTDWTAGVTWRPSESLSLQVTYSEREEAPSLSQLGSPVVESFNVPTFDLTNGESVLTTDITGGNPNLPAETQRDWKVGAYYDVDLFDRSRISVEYFRIRSEDVSASFPILTPEIEAAFPDRVTRDASGRLTAIDRRPISFAERNRERVRFGFNLSGRIGKTQQRGGAGGRGAGGRGERGEQGAAPGRVAVGPNGPTEQGGPRGQGRPRGGGGNFDPARMAQMREKFCSSDPKAELDISGFPPFVQDRLRNADGSLNREAIAQARARFCSSDDARPRPEQGAGPGPGGRRPDPARREAIRAVICKNAGDDSLPDLSSLPERMAARLQGADGKIDPERLAMLRGRMCADGANANLATGQGQQQGQGATQGSAQQAAGRPRGRGGPNPFGRNRPGRWRLSLYHTVEFENEALIAPGVPVLDLLDGAALGSRANSRHTAQLEGGIFHRGVGMRLSGNYLSSGRIDGSGLPGSTTLFYDDMATFNLRMFINLEQQEWLAGDNPGFLKGARMSLRANNLFNTRRRITDDAGNVPLSFQPGLVDPIGRLVEIEFRKVF